MTEKCRYCYVLDNGKPTFYDLNKKDILQMYQVEDLLNKQDERINELESENKMLKVTIERNESYIKRLTMKGKWSNTGDVE